MQVQKENIRKAILNIARDEFIKQGFKNASMRTISTKSEVGLSNIYNYFKNKDEIFCQVLSPLLKAFDNISRDHNNTDYITTDVFTMQVYQERMINDFMVLIKNFKEELRLLLFCASGSSLEDFRDSFTNKHTESGVKYMELMKQKYPNINDDISVFFIHTISSWWLTILGEIISHEELKENDTKKFLSEFIAFGTAGWKKILKI